MRLIEDERGLRYIEAGFFDQQEWTCVLPQRGIVSVNKVIQAQDAFCAKRAVGDFLRERGELRYGPSQVVPIIQPDIKRAHNYSNAMREALCTISSEEIYEREEAAIYYFTEAQAPDSWDEPEPPTAA